MTATSGPANPSRARLDARSTWPLVVLGVVSVIYRYIVQAGKPTSWHFFRDAGETLLHHGLNLYTLHPEYQFGPLAAVAALPFQPLPHVIARPVIVIVGSALGVLTLVLLERLVLELQPGVDPRRIRRGVYWAALPVLYAWSDIAVRNEHIDDALALVGIIAAGLAIARRCPWVATVLMAVAIAAKPWAIVCVPMLAAFPGKGRLTRPAVACAAAGATWVPFILGAPKTLSRLAHFTIATSRESGLRAVGITATRTPHWDRPAQLVLGLAIAVLLVRLDRWWAVPMSALGVRLLLDPGTHRYYTVGLALGVLLWELVVAPKRIPWRTVVVVVLIELTATAGPFGGQSDHIRFVVLLAAVVWPLWESWRSRSGAAIAEPVGPVAPAPATLRS